MKKIIYFAFAMAALAACSKEKASISEGDKAFRIEVIASTKPSFDEETYKVSWKNNDQLHVLVNGTPYTFTKVADVDNAFECTEFTPEDGVTYDYEILNPYRSDYGEGVFTYSGGVKLTMYGQGSAVGAATPSIHMQHLTSIIKTEITNTGDVDLKVNSIKIESDTDNIGGRYRISGGAMTPINPVKYTEMDNQNVSISVGETKAMFVQCAPFTTTAGSKLTITLTAGSDKFTKEINFPAGKEVSFNAGKVKTTTMSIEVEPVDDTEANIVYIDFGKYTTTSSSPYWNSYNGLSVSTDATVLKNGNNNDTELKIQTTKEFEGWGGSGGEGTKNWTENGYTYLVNTWKDGLLAKTNPGQLVISGCDPDATYHIETLHIRYNGSRGPRIIDIDINGTVVENFDTGMPANTAEGTYTYHNIFDNITPKYDSKFDKDGNDGYIIEITITPLLGSSNTTKEGPINAMIIKKK